MILVRPVQKKASEQVTPEDFHNLLKEVKAQNQTHTEPMDSTYLPVFASCTIDDTANKNNAHLTFGIDRWNALPMNTWEYLLNTYLKETCYTQIHGNQLLLIFRTLAQKGDLWNVTWLKLQCARRTFQQVLPGRSVPRILKNPGMMNSTLQARVIDAKKTDVHPITSIAYACFRSLTALWTLCRLQENDYLTYYTAVQKGRGQDPVSQEKCLNNLRILTCRKDGVSRPYLWQAVIKHMSSSDTTAIILQTILQTWTDNGFLEMLDNARPEAHEYFEDILVPAYIHVEKWTSINSVQICASLFARIFMTDQSLLKKEKTTKSNISKIFQQFNNTDMQKSISAEKPSLLEYQFWHLYQVELMQKLTNLQPLLNKASTSISICQMWDSSGLLKQLSYFSTNDPTSLPQILAPAFNTWSILTLGESPNSFSPDTPSSSAHENVADAADRSAQRMISGSKMFSPSVSSALNILAQSQRTIPAMDNRTGSGSTISSADDRETGENAQSIIHLRRCAVFISEILIDLYKRNRILYNNFCKDALLYKILKYLLFDKIDEILAVSKRDDVVLDAFIHIFIKILNNRTSNDDPKIWEHFNTLVNRTSVMPNEDYLALQNMVNIYNPSERMDDFCKHKKQYSNFKALLDVEYPQEVWRWFEVLYSLAPGPFPTAEDKEIYDMICAQSCRLHKLTNTFLPFLAKSRFNFTKKHVNAILDENLDVNKCIQQFRIANADNVFTEDAFWDAVVDRHTSSPRVKKTRKLPADSPYSTSAASAASSDLSVLSKKRCP